MAENMNPRWRPAHLVFYQKWDIGSKIFDIYPHAKFDAATKIGPLQKSKYNMEAAAILNLSKSTIFGPNGYRIANANKIWYNSVHKWYCLWSVHAENEIAHKQVIK